MKPRRATYDAVVVGAGVAGAATAWALRRRGCSVLLVNGGVRRPPPVGETLAPVACQLLATMGIRPERLQGQHLPNYGSESSWGSDLAGSWDTVFSPYGHGWSLDRWAFDATLQQQAVAHGADMVTGVSVYPAAYDAARWTLLLGRGAERSAVRSRWLVDATGRRRTVSRWLRVGKRRVDRLVAFVALYGCGRDADADGDGSTTRVEAVPDGWWYTAQTPGGRRVLMFFTEPDTPAFGLARSPEGFRELLGQTSHVSAPIRDRDLSMLWGPRGRDAASERLEQVSGPGWLAVGDAAVALDPLSAQGITNALAMGFAAGDAIAGAFGDDGAALDLYHRRVMSTWSTYQAERVRVYSRETRWASRPFWDRRRFGLAGGSTDSFENVEHKPE